MKISQLSMAILSVAALTACGGSGSNNPLSESGSSNPPEELAINSFDNNVLKGGIIVRVVNDEKDYDTITAGSKDNNQDLNTITVNGKTYQIPTQGNGDWDKVYTDHNMKYARFAFLEKDKRITTFYQGFPTQDMPNEGTVRYSGRAVNHNSRTDTTTELQSNFVVNFTDKTLTGQLSNDKEKIELAAHITGNTFAGQKGKYITQGGFYGPKAADLAGVYRNKNHTMIGAYGASRGYVTSRPGVEATIEGKNVDGGLASGKGQVTVSEGSF